MTRTRQALPLTDLPTAADPATQMRSFRTELPTARNTDCMHLNTNVRRLRRRMERITLRDWIAYWRARGWLK